MLDINGHHNQGCQVFTRKPAQILALLHFRRSPPVKIAFQGINFMLFGVASNQRQFIRFYAYGGEFFMTVFLKLDPLPKKKTNKKNHNISPFLQCHNILYRNPYIVIPYSQNLVSVLNAAAICLTFPIFFHSLELNSRHSIAVSSFCISLP